MFDSPTVVQSSGHARRIYRCKTLLIPAQATHPASLKAHSYRNLLHRPSNASLGKESITKDERLSGESQTDRLRQLKRTPHNNEINEHS